MGSTVSIRHADLSVAFRLEWTCKPNADSATFRDITPRGDLHRPSNHTGLVEALHAYTRYNATTR